jgi:hypothetical protein
VLGESMPPGNVFATIAGVENITTRFGQFQATRVDITQEYRVQTMNHSDPSGIIKASAWYVCGVGILRATVNHSGTYQARSFDRVSELELFSFTPLP